MNSNEIDQYIKLYDSDGNEITDVSNISDGDTIKIVLTVPEGYQFVEWRDIDGSRSDPYPEQLSAETPTFSLTVSCGTHYIAAFKKKEDVYYDIDTDITCDSCGETSGGGRIISGGPVSIGVVIYDGGCCYKFIGWSKDGGSTIETDSNPYQFTARESGTYTAVVEKISMSYLFTGVGCNVNVTTTSSVEGQGHRGDTITAVVTPYQYYDWVGWNDGNTENPRTINVECGTSLDFVATCQRAMVDISTSMSGCDGGDCEVTEGGTYYSGDTVTLKATPDCCHEFAGWYHEGVEMSTENPYSFIAQSSVAGGYTAKFIDKLLGLTIHVAEPNSVEIITHGPYKCGSVVSIKAVPAEGYEFSQWSDGNTNATRTVTIGEMDDNCENNIIEAVFKEREVLYIAVGVSGAGCTDTATTHYSSNHGYDGDPITISVENTKCDCECEFAGWYKGDTELVCLDEEYSFILNSDTAATYYAHYTHTLITGLEFGAEDSQLASHVIVNGAKESYSCGDSVYIEAESIVSEGDGYYFAGWTDGESMFVNPRTITIDCDTVSAKAMYVRKSACRVTITAEGCDSCNSAVFTGAGEYELGATPTLSLTSYNTCCCNFGRWFRKTGTTTYEPLGTPGATSIQIGPLGDSTTMWGWAASYEIVARFTQKNVSSNITISHSTGGTATSDMGDTIHCGDTINLTATPDTGYKFAGWSINDSTEIISNEASYAYVISCDDMDSDCNLTIHAKFVTEDTREIHASSTYDGDCSEDINVSVTGDFFIGGDVIFEAEEGNDIQFIEWRDENGGRVSTDSSYTYRITDTTEDGYTLYAYYESRNASINISTNDESMGTVSVEDNNTPTEMRTFTCCHTIRLTPTHKNCCYIFDRWVDGNGTTISTDNPFEHVVSYSDDSATIEAVFVEREIHINNDANNDNGKVTVAGGETVCHCGETVKFNIYKDEGYKVDAVYLNGDVYPLENLTPISSNEYQMTVYDVQSSLLDENCKLSVYAVFCQDDGRHIEVVEEYPASEEDITTCSDVTISRNGGRAVNIADEMANPSNYSDGDSVLIKVAFNTGCKYSVDHWEYINNHTGDNVTISGLPDINEYYFTVDASTEGTYKIVYKL